MVCLDSRSVASIITLEIAVASQAETRIPGLMVAETVTDRM